MNRNIEQLINEAWEERSTIHADSAAEDIRQAVDAVLAGLDSGTIRVAEPMEDGAWQVNQWVKKAVLLSFRLQRNQVMGSDALRFYDKVPSKFEQYDEADFIKGGFRVVPAATVRRGAYIGRDVVIMPSFVNIGAYVGDGTMVDTWATVGSCAQIGKNVHLSGGVGIGGVLEPLQANPTIIEDNCFIEHARKSLKASSWRKIPCWRWVCFFPRAPVSMTAVPARFSMDGYHRALSLYQEASCFGRIA